MRYAILLEGSDSFYTPYALLDNCPSAVIKAKDEQIYYKDCSSINESGDRLTLWYKRLEDNKITEL